jgi:hypothetical protein
MLHRQPVIALSVVLGVAGPLVVFAFADDERGARTKKSI